MVIPNEPPQSSRAGPRILRGLADCYFWRAGRHSELELHLFDSVIAMVLERVEPFARREFAERLADQVAPPPRVLIFLATDEISVATPILQRSPALTDATLARLASDQPQSHLAVIAARRPLAESVTDVLVARGDRVVVEALARNGTARLSEDSFMRLAQREELHEMLMARPDLPEEIAERLAPLIRDTVQDVLAANLAHIDAQTTDDLTARSREALAQRLRAIVSTARPADVLGDLVSRGLLSIDDALTELADADRAVEVATLMAEKLAIGPELVMLVLFSPNEEAMTILCRASGLGINGFSSVLRMRRRRRRSTRPPAQVLSAFLQIEIDRARRSVDLYRNRFTRKGVA